MTARSYGAFHDVDVVATSWTPRQAEMAGVCMTWSGAFVGPGDHGRVVGAEDAEDVAVRVAEEE
ncbi:hypothetical protein [Streptomyces sp. NPDC021622]|uniref:hypothetical protein n=1 Tax=Streptomyces sp. NPDC021622 TaxID=3155013 RepID=UPI00340F857B